MGVARHLPVALLALLCACGEDPGEIAEQVGYRDGIISADEGFGDANSGERGTIQISEVLWSGSVTDEGSWDRNDIFIELRNEGMRPMNLSRWFLYIEGAIDITYRIPESEFDLEVGQHRFIAAKTTGCFPNPDWVIPDLQLPLGDPFRITIRDADERLINSSGDKYMLPFAGGYDLAVSRSMEKVELMFGGRGDQPTSWHHYTRAEVEVPNNDRVAEGCRVRTQASPGRPNSPDYSGAFSSGALD